MTLRVIKNNRVKGKKIGFDPTKSGQLADNVRVFSTSGCRLSNTLLHRTVNRHRQIKGGAADYQDNEVDASDDTGVRGVDLHIQMDGKPKPQKEVDTFKEKYPDFFLH
eukprot:XP_019924017.1 PREDICTED: uncharacterized protein LOC109619095 [Crassostrea gigas]